MIRRCSPCFPRLRLCRVADCRSRGAFASLLEIRGRCIRWFVTRLGVTVAIVELGIARARRRRCTVRGVTAHRPRIPEHAGIVPFQAESGRRVIGFASFRRCAASSKFFARRCGDVDGKVYCLRVSEHAGVVLVHVGSRWRGAQSVDGQVSPASLVGSVTK
jgi:hypothetical protein